MFNVSGNWDIERHPIADITVNSTIGFNLVYDIEDSTNWLLILPNAPKKELIPKPIPLNGRGNISVIYKKKTEKYAHIPNLAVNTRTIWIILTKHLSHFFS